MKAQPESYALIRKYMGQIQAAASNQITLIDSSIPPRAIDSAIVATFSGSNISRVDGSFVRDGFFKGDIVVVVGPVYNEGKSATVSDVTHTQLSCSDVEGGSFISETSVQCRIVLSGATVPQVCTYARPSEVAALARSPMDALDQIETSFRNPIIATALSMLNRGKLDSPKIAAVKTGQSIEVFAVNGAAIQLLGTFPRKA